MMYDVVIIGAGPAGIMAAHKLLDHGLKILLIDKGKDLCKRKDLICGWFGSGFSEINNLNLSSKTRHSASLVKKIIKQKIPKEQVDLSLSVCQGEAILKYFHDELKNKVEFIFGAEVIDIDKTTDCFKIILENKEVYGKKCILACGKYSFEFLNKISNKFDLKTSEAKNKIGVRAEVPLRFYKDVCFSNNNVLVFEDLRKDSSIGEWEESDVLSSFATIALEKSKTVNFFIGLEETPEACLRYSQITNVLNNGKIKKEYVKEFFSSRSITHYVSVFDPIKDFLKTLHPKVTEYMAVYIPEIRLCGILIVDKNQVAPIKDLYAIGHCVFGIDSVMLAMESGWKVGEKILKEF